MINEAVASWRRRRKYAQIRREFARHGVSLEKFGDEEVESALTRGVGSIDDLTLNSKIIYLASRRLKGRGRSKRRVSVAPAAGGQ